MAILTSAGILLFRRHPATQVLLGHMGGPFWARKDAGAWSVPKGEHGPAEDPWAAARREFTEELGLDVPDGTPIDLGTVTQKNGKQVRVWALHADPDLTAVVFGTFTMEWPRGSGRRQEFGELDRVGWFDLDEARGKLVSAQVEFLDRLAATLAEPDGA